MVTRENISNIIERANSIESAMDSMIKEILTQLGAVDEEHAVHFGGNCPMLTSSELEGGDDLVNVTDVWVNEDGIRANYKAWGSLRVYKDMSIAAEADFSRVSFLSYLADKI